MSIIESGACKNYKRSALGRARILASVISYSKKVTVSESREIARVAYLGKITIIGCGRMENYKMSAPSTAGILECAINY